MNGIETIIEKILADAKEQQEQILAQAATQVAEIKARYTAEAESRRRELEQAGAQQAEQAEQRVLAGADLEARKNLLAEKQSLIDQAFAAAVQHVEAFETQEQQKLLLELLVQAVESGTETVLLPAGPRAAYGEALLAEADQALQKAGRRGELQLAAETPQLGLGFMLREGSTQINCELEALIWNMREALAIEVAAVLFPAE